MKRRDLLAHLSARDCVLEREGSRHSQWIHRVTRRRTTVPRHSEIKNGIARKICKDLGVEDPFSRK